MKKTMLLASAAMFGVVFLAANVNAQGVPQTVEIKVDVQKVSAGYRASKVIGSSIVNDSNETIGKIDDLLVTRDGKSQTDPTLKSLQNKNSILDTAKAIWPVN